MYAFTGVLGEKATLICALALKGYSNPQLAQYTGLTVAGVKYHLAIIFKHYGVSTKIGLIKKYLDGGIII